MASKFINGINLDSTDFKISIRSALGTLNPIQTATFNASWGNIYQVDASVSSINITLPASVSIQQGNSIIVNRTDSSANSVTIVTSAAEKYLGIQTNANFISLKSNGSVKINCTGTQPAVIDWDNPASVSNLWTPSDAVGLGMWFEPSGLTTVGALTTWNGKSGNGEKGEQTDVARKPNVVLNDLNGYSTIEFDGVADNFVLTPFNVLDGKTEAATFVVYNNTGVSLNGELIRINPAMISRVTSAGQWQAFYSNGVSLISDVINSTNNSWHIGGTGRTSTLVTAYIDGVSSGSPTAVTGTMPVSTAGAIGCMPVNAAQFFGGKIAEILVFGSDVDTTTRQKIEGYLAWKYALTTLDAGHIYKNSPSLTVLVTY